MTAREKTYEADAELAELIRTTVETGEPLRIVAGGRTYRVTATPDERGRPDAETVKRSIEGIRAAAGTWSDLDVEEIKAYLAERRRQPGRPPVEL